nr:MAG: putative capsid protein [Picobirnavirus sp.]
MANNNNKNRDFEKNNADLDSKNNSNKRQNGRNNRKNGRNTTNRRSFNDPSWYAKTPQLLIDSSSLAYQYALGSPLTIEYLKPTIPADKKFHQYVDEYFADERETKWRGSMPGIWTIGIVPTYGVCNSPVSAANISARNLYSFVRHANSGHTNYEAADLMLYILAMDSIFSLYQHCARAYGVMRLYSQDNRYLAKALVTAMGFDYDDLSSQMADFRAFINLIAVKASAYKVPADFTMYIRHMWMYANIFADSNSPKAQSYLFVPDGFWQYEEYQGAGKLVFKAFGGAKKLAHLKSYVNALFNPIIASEDCNIMSGDIQKAFGEKCFGLSTIAEDYSVGISYNPEVLEQIHNARAYELDRTIEITQDVDVGSATEGCILYQPKVSYTIGGNNSIKSPIVDRVSMVLDLGYHAPEPGINMVATRLWPTIGNGALNGTGYTADILSCGSEIPVRFEIYEFDADHALQSTEFTSNVGFNFTGTTVNPEAAAAQIGQVIRMFNDVERFDCHPFISFASNVITATETTQYAPEESGDTTVMTLVTKEDLRKMHDTAILSELNVPAY